MRAINCRRGEWAAVASLPRLVLVSWLLAGMAAAEEAPRPLDLAAFAPWTEEATVTPAHDDSTLALLPPTTSVTRELTVPSVQRFYMTSIVGGSFFVVTADTRRPRR